MRVFLEQIIDLYIGCIDALADFLHVNSLVVLFLVIYALCSICFFAAIIVVACKVVWLP